MNLKRIAIDALYLSVPLAVVGGLATYAAQSGLSYVTPTHTIEISTSDTPPPSLSWVHTPLPECTEEDGSGGPLPCDWDGVRGPGHGTGHGYRVNADLSVTRYLGEV